MLYLKSESEVAQSCPTLSDPMDCSPPGSSVLEIFQARILEQVTISYSRESSSPREQTHVFCTGRQILYHYATWEAHGYQNSPLIFGASLALWATVVAQAVTNLPAMQETRVRKIPGEGNGNPLQFSCLGNPMDRGIQ